jgi:hypothetical protein
MTQNYPYHSWVRLEKTLIFAYNVVFRLSVELFLGIVLGQALGKVGLVLQVWLFLGLV